MGGGPYDDGIPREVTTAYDYENRLISLTSDIAGDIKTVTFKYDPFGRRIEKKVEKIEYGEQVTKTYTYIYDNEDIIQETLVEVAGTTSTTTTRKYMHGPGIDEPLQIEVDGTPY